MLGQESLALPGQQEAKHSLWSGIKLRDLDLNYPSLEGLSSSAQNKNSFTLFLIKNVIALKKSIRKSTNLTWITGEGDAKREDETRPRHPPPHLINRIADI